MYTLEEAKEKTVQYINAPKKYNYPGDSDIECVITGHMEKPYGWVFYYQSKKYTERDDRDAVVGNAPYLFEKDTGDILPLGYLPSVDYYLDLYEKGEWNAHAEYR